MTVEDIKKEMVRLQGMAKGIKLETGLLRADINKLEGCIKQDDEASNEAYQRGYEEGFKEGRTRKELSDAQGYDYLRGYRDAWDLATRITLDDHDGGIPIEELKAVFNVGATYRIFKDFGCFEIASKLKEHEAKKAKEQDDAIRVGDIVRYKKDDHLDLYVLKVYDDKLSFKGLVISDSRAHSCGDTISLCFNDDYVKTGRHHDFGKILEFLKS